MIPAKGVQVDTSQRCQILHLAARHLEDRARLAARPAGIDENHLGDTTHLEGHIHAAGTAISALHSLGQAAIPHPMDEHRPRGIIATQQVAAANHERSHARLLPTARI